MAARPILEAFCRASLHKELRHAYCCAWRSLRRTIMEQDHNFASVIRRRRRELELTQDARELFFLANPQTRDLISCTAEQDTTSVWEAFAQNEKLHRTHKITGQ